MNPGILIQRNKLNIMVSKNWISENITELLLILFRYEYGLEFFFFQKKSLSLEDSRLIIYK